MKFFSIKSSWVALAPAKRLDVAYWGLVVDNLTAAGVAHDSATDDEVRAAMDKVASDARDKEAAAKALRLQAREIDAQAKAIEESIPQGKLD